MRATPFPLPRTAPILLALSLLACPGCFWGPPEPTDAELDCGLIWLLPGIEGGPTTLDTPYRAYRDAGVDAAIRIHDPLRPFGLITNLVDWGQNRVDAAAVADKIVVYRATHPDAPVDLVGYSGGSAMVILVAEELPEDFQLRNVILLGAGISRDYDLTAALRRIHGKLVNFHSHKDEFFLDWFTSTFGTMDRKFVPSAGKDGFDVELAVPDEPLRERLEQIPWTEQWQAVGHWGGHLAMFVREWNTRYVAPYLLSKAQQLSPTTQSTSAPPQSPDPDHESSP